MMSSAIRKTEVVLALDQGGHGSRAALVSVDDGRILVIHEDQVPIQAEGSQAEQDAQALLDSLLRVLARACMEPGLHIRAAGLATQRSPILCWRRSSIMPLGPVLGWQDRRAAHLLPTDAAQITEIERRTGLVVNAHYGASKLRWSLQHNAAAVAAAQQNDLAAGPLAAFLVQGLTRSEQPLVDAINASRSLLLNRDSRAWDSWLLQRFAVPMDVLPQVQPALSDFGRLCIGNLPLRLVTGDQSAVPFAFGTPDADTLYLNLGTGAFLQRVPGPSRALPPLLENPLPAQPWRAMEGTVNGAATALDLFTSSSAGRGTADSHGPVGQRLEALTHLSVDAPVFLNAVGGLGSPDWRHDLSSRFIGVAQPEPGLAMAIVAESIVFLVQRNLDTMQQQIAAPRRILVSGGLSCADALCQAMADLSGLPVLRPAEHEATALGVAVLLGAAHRAADGPGSHWLLPRSNPVLAQRYRRWSEAMALALG